MRRFIPLFLVLTFLSAGFSKDFKSMRVSKISPLSDTLNSAAAVKINSAVMKSFSAFNDVSPNKSWRMKINSLGYPEVLAGDKTKKYRGNSTEVFNSFLGENSGWLGVQLENLQKQRETYFYGVRHLEYKQLYKNVPVEFSYVKLHYNDNGEISLYQAKYYKDISLDVNPSFGSAFANMAVKSELGRFENKKNELVVYPDTDGSFKLAWKITGRGGMGSNSGLWVFYVDAHSGKILFKYDDLRYVCNSPYNQSTGTVKGYVYDISPIPTGSSDLQSQYWQPKVLRNMDNQYVWMQDYRNKVVSGISNGASSGEYCSNVNGKVFSLFQGPYFTVSRFMAPSSYFTNGTAVWTTQATPVTSANPYANDTTYEYSASLSDNWTASNRGFAFAAPFFSSFRVGSLDACGSSIDSDFLEISSGAFRMGYYTGNKSGFIGGYSPYPAYKMKLKTDSAGTYSGFSVAVSSYMVMSSSYPAVNATGSIVWSTTTNLLDGNGAEANAFYHLNKVKSYFDFLNKDPNSSSKPINIDSQIPVMSGVFGDVTNDYCTDPNSMWNAFYDLEHDYIFLGRGPMDIYSNYRDFALDGTIVRHEYIHLVINRIYPIINFGEFGAISEAVSDYFALASFWNDALSIDVLGNFIGEGEAVARNINTASKKMPDDWQGEVHDDSMILSPALYKIRKNASYDIGSFSSGIFSGLHRADVFTFAALFYFPDNFTNFLEAMLDACKQLDPVNCNSTMQQKIKDAFAVHQIYPASASGSLNDKYEPNNGPQWATNVSTFTSLAAFIDYSGDLDYYSIPLNKGLFAAKINLPKGSIDSMYHAYSIFLFDQNRKYLSEAVPSIYSCPPAPGSKECLSLSDSATLVYDIPASGRYYLMVSAAPSEYGGNSADYNSSRPYSLTYEGNISGSVISRMYNPAVDADEIAFEAKYPKFSYIVHPASSSWNDGSEIVFTYARLLDHNFTPITLTETDNASSYMGFVTGTLEKSLDALNNPIVKGRVKLRSQSGKGFSAQYPAIGTVYLEIFGTNHMWDVAKTSNAVSLGISNAINLTTNKSGFVAYNNIIGPANSKTYLRYDLQTGGNLSIKVYTAAGSLVKIVYEGVAAAGKGTFEWDGKNDSGSKVASGIYFIKTEGPGVNKVDRVAIIR